MGRENSIMQSNYMASKANWIIWCIDSEDGFTMLGSRKVNGLDLEVNYGSYMEDLSIFRTPGASGGYLSYTYSLTGLLAGFTMVVAKTEFEAFITLMHTFQEEERLEKVEAERRAASLKEEKKREKAHKKAKRQAEEGKFDANKCPETCYYCKEETEACDCDEYYC